MFCASMTKLLLQKKLSFNPCSLRKIPHLMMMAKILHHLICALEKQFLSLRSQWSELRRSLLVKAIMSWQLPSPVDLMAFQWLSSTIFLQNFLLSCPNFPWMCINRQVSFLLKFDSVVPFPKKASDLSQPSSYQSFPNRRQNLRTAHEHDINFLESQHLLSNMQYTCIYDFRHSLSSPTSYLAQHISRVLDRQDENRSVALDISKALDKSWHQSLHKLLSHGITGPLHQLLTSFLKGRQMSVVLDGQKSSTKHINTGVPQGSILRPTLSLFFSIFQMTLSASWWCTQTTPLSKTSLLNQSRTLRNVSICVKCWIRI